MPFGATTALVMPHGDRVAIPLVYKYLIVIGYGRDLLVYDWLVQKSLLRSG